MLGERIQKALNEQINAETYSSYLYLSMSTWFESNNFKGFAKWMRIQALEESCHVLKIMDYIHEQGGRVLLTAVEAPDTEWDSPLAAFEAAYAHEQLVSGLIGKLMDIALEERDHASTIMLQWFVSEQVEEEATADEIVQQLKLMADAPGGLFLLDREMSARTFTAPEGTTI